VEIGGVDGDIIRALTVTLERTPTLMAAGLTVGRTLGVCAVAVAERSINRTINCRVETSDEKKRTIARIPRRAFGQSMRSRIH
jgi:hypothetical protein